MVKAHLFIIATIECLLPGHLYIQLLFALIVVMSKLLKDKIALVTGGGGGVGWGICKELAEEGAKIIIVDVDEKSGKEVLDEILEISEGHKFYKLDIAVVEDLEKFMQKIYKNDGSVDILINNAGINTPNKFLDMTVENWDAVHNVNLRGHFFLSQNVAKNMIKNKIEGKIIFISSVHQKIIQKRPHYSSSKAAISILVKEMAIELAPHNIRVNTIAPGGIDVRGKVTDPKYAKDDPPVPLRRKSGIPSDVGRAVVFLASDHWSRHITGSTVTVSGGQYIDPTLNFNSK